MKKKVYIFIVLLGPIILNFLFIIFNFISKKGGNFLFDSNLNNSDWLSFLGSYIPAIITLYSIFILIKNNQDLLKSQTKEMIYRNKKDDLERTKDILLEVLISIDTEIFSKFSVTINKNDFIEQKQIFIKAKENFTRAKIKFELLTDVTISFENCNCKEKTCKKRQTIENMRNEYYQDMEIYWDLINFFLSKIIPLKERIFFIENNLNLNIGDRNKQLNEIKVLYKELENIIFPKFEEVSNFRNDKTPILQLRFKEYLNFREDEIKNFLINEKCK